MRNTSVSEFLELKKGDKFVVGGVEHVAASDTAYCAVDELTDLPAVYDEEGRIYFEDAFLDDDAAMDERMNLFLWDLLKDHFGHKVEIAIYGDVDNPASVTLEDMDTNEVILDAGIYTLCAREDV